MISRRRFSRVEDALDAIAAGRLVIVVDAEEREDEGDLITAAETITPQKIHFMISEGRGQVCLPLLPAIANRLQLRRMATGDSLEAPNFTVPIDHCQCKTGISPFERAATIRAVLDPASTAHDFIRPGHMFPLVAREEGVLARPGHTEASVDLARLAGLTPAAVLCEICSRDGMYMAGREELSAMAMRHRLPIITIDDLIDFRRRHTTNGHAPAIPSLERNGVVMPAVAPKGLYYRITAHLQQVARSMLSRSCDPSLAPGVIRAYEGK